MGTIGSAGMALTSRVAIGCVPSSGRAGGSGLASTSSPSKLPSRPLLPRCRPRRQVLTGRPRRTRRTKVVVTCTEMSPLELISSSATFLFLESWYNPVTEIVTRLDVRLCYFDAYDLCRYVNCLLYKFYYTL